MSKEYDEYLKEHVCAVNQAYHWLYKNLPWLFDNISMPDFEKQIKEHDKSKYSRAEYIPYDIRFYGDGIEEDPAYRRAWLEHIHTNGHHWQHWLLIDDDGTMLALDIPQDYLIEMICDWWSFSWVSKDLFNIFIWYAQNKENMMLSHNTRSSIEKILSAIKKTLRGNTF